MVIDKTVEKEVLLEEIAAKKIMFVDELIIAIENCFPKEGRLMMGGLAYYPFYQSTERGEYVHLIEHETIVAATIAGVSDLGLHPGSSPLFIERYGGPNFTIRCSEENKPNALKLAEYWKSNHPGAAVTVDYADKALTEEEEQNEPLRWCSSMFLVPPAQKKKT